MRFSVIVNTYNRAACLRQLLLALKYQTYKNFEVIVVNGPSTDDTAQVLAEYAGQIRAYDCPVTNLSLSRNIGIIHAAGDVVTFIDDDGIPEPQWLQEMHDGFIDASIAAVGGIVYDHTGYALQYASVICDRMANATVNVKPPLRFYQHPGSDPYVHLMGGNTSFQRNALADVGGFDQEIEYFLDEADICMHLTDLGYRLEQLPNAAMHHKSAPSHVRSPKGILRRPFPVIKNKAYFCLQSARNNGISFEKAIEAISKFVEEFLSHAKCWLHSGLLSPEEYTQYVQDVERGLRVGMERGLTQNRKRAVIPPSKPEDFLPFPTITPTGKRLIVALISANYPPEPLGGIGRLTHSLALGLAQQGHEVHVITRTPDHNRVDLEAGVWVHRIQLQTTGDWYKPELSPLLVRCLGWSAAAQAEVHRLQESRTIDIVSSTIWDSEGLFCQLDNQINYVLTLVTSLKTVTDLCPSVLDTPGIDKLLQMEAVSIRLAKTIVAPSQDVLNKARRDTGLALANASVVPLGVARPSIQPSRKTSDRLRILTVGRLEKRKGTDLFLAAAALLAPRYPYVEFVLVGNDNSPGEGLGQPYKEDFAQRYSKTDWFNRIHFLGEISEERLAEEYAACDIFCLPARYESFGLVLTEAMSFGKPTIAAEVGGMKEIVVHQETGLLVPPDDALALTLALERLIRDPAFRQTCAEQALCRYEEYFSIEKMTLGMLNVFKQVTV